MSWRRARRSRTVENMAAAVPKVLKQTQVCPFFIVLWNKAFQKRHYNVFSIKESHRKIIISDEAYLQLGGFAKKQNCRIWGSENPRIIIENPLHPQWVHVLCGFWSGRVIRPYFFENEAAATLKRLHYREMIYDISLWLELDDTDLDNLHFPEEGLRAIKQRNHWSFTEKVSDLSKTWSQ